MDFARKQMEKYGWTDGQGLGKNNNGISAPLKPKLKFDNAGIGHDQAKDLVDSWWTNVYKSALDNVEVKNETNGNVEIGLKGEESIDISSKSYINVFKKNNVSLEYGSFVKTAQISASGTINYDVPELLDDDKSKVKVLTDEELFAACSGRTAHKGARHGLKLSGKLDRLAKQEQMLLKKLQNVSLNDKTDVEKKMKKLVKSKTNDDSSNLFLDVHPKTSSSSKKKHKKKKKQRKSVSFNETVTVTEYIPPDLDSSVLSSDSNENSIISCSEQTLNDEGIEHDIDAYNGEENQRSFEEGRFENDSVEDISHDSKFIEGNSVTEEEIIEDNRNEDKFIEEKLSKAEHRLKKKNRATHRFLRNLRIENESDRIEKVLCAKRKFPDNDDVKVKRMREGEEGGVKKKKKKKKELKLKKQEKQKKRSEKKSLINSITKSLDTLCYISDDS